MKSILVPQFESYGSNGNENELWSCVRNFVNFLNFHLIIIYQITVNGALTEKNFMTNSLQTSFEKFRFVNKQ